MIEIRNPGIGTSIQGRGFRGHRHTAVPLCGPADALSLALANYLAGNPCDAAGIETAYAPFSFRVHSAAHIGIQGAPRDISLNDMLCDPHRSISAKPGDVISLSAAVSGCHSYIAISGGGLRAAEIFGGNSTYVPARLGGSAGIDSYANAQLPILQDRPPITSLREIPAHYRIAYGHRFILRCVIGPEFEWLSAASRDQLSARDWQISARSNRIGSQLAGEALTLASDKQIDSSAVFPGTVQCPPSGIPFLLGPDAQTTGGYPRIAQIIRADRHVIGQLRAGSVTKFQLTTPDKAARIYLSKLSLLRKLLRDIQLD